MADLTGTNQGSIDISLRRLELSDYAEPAVWNPQLQTIADNFAYIRDQLDTLDQYAADYEFERSDAPITSLYTPRDEDNRKLLRIDTTNNPVEVRLLGLGFASQGVTMRVARVNGLAAPSDDYSDTANGTNTEDWGFECVALDHNGAAYVGYRPDVDPTKYLRKYDASGVQLWEVASPIGALKRVRHPHVATLLVGASDGDPCRLAKFDTNAGAVGGTVEVGGGTGAEEVLGLAITKDLTRNIVVAVGPSPHRIRQYTSGLIHTWTYPVPSGTPSDVQVDPRDNTVVYAVSDHAEGVRKLNTNGVLRWQADTGSGVGSVGVDRDGNIYYVRTVLNTNGVNEVGKLSPLGQILWTAKVPTGTDDLNGALAVDGNGYILVGTATENDIYLIHPDTGQALAKLTRSLSNAFDPDPTLTEIATSPYGHAASVHWVGGGAGSGTARLYGFHMTPFAARITAGSSADGVNGDPDADIILPVEPHTAYRLTKVEGDYWIATR